MSDTVVEKLERGGPAAPNWRKVVVAGLIGNVMEWYDFAVYGYFASIIGTQFFPSENPAISLISAFGAFAAGFLMRPIGAILFGHIGDTLGRKRVLTLSVLAMAVPTTLIGLLPNFETIGILAPIMIVLLRMMQGLSVGGEYTSSVVFMVERAPENRRSFFGMWSMWGAIFGIMLGSGIGGAVATIFGDETLANWGWRIPFLLGSLVALTSYLVRRAMDADEETKKSDSPVKDTFVTHYADVIKVILLDIGYAVTFYVAFVYLVTYLKVIDKLPAEEALNINTGSMIILLLLIPLTSYLCDRIGRKPVLVFGYLLLTFGAVPFFAMIHTADLPLIFFGQFGFVLGFACVSSAATAANVEMLPAAVRCTSYAVAYNAAIGLFGGVTPMIVTWLVTTTGNPIMPAYWVAGASAISLAVAIFVYKETRHRAFVK